MTLTVKEAPREAVGNDIVHIHASDRGAIQVNRVCKIICGKHSIFATVRGNKNQGEILIDHQLRILLDVNIDKEYEFSIVYKRYYFLIAPLTSTNVGVRAAYYIAIVSLFISLLPYIFDLSQLVITSVGSFHFN